ncbi:hypothetical protein [Sanyastnella coralliicola]|uniref:hypothetical protein n=1 Tax=Sanyastnella coralliicola TaxID=3069118 RepID=UPI0027BAD582|nr:hypothetical protein [Longitalea sp. SCSIO 12813]
MTLSKSAKFLGAILALCCLFISPESIAQADVDQDLLVVQMTEIDAYSYGDMARSLKGNDQFSINEACVPGKLVVFNIDDNNLSREEAFQTLKGLIAEATELEAIELTEMSKSDFSSTCMDVRRGITGQ